MKQEMIGREDIEALIKGKKDITEFLVHKPSEGIVTCFGEPTSSNSRWMLRGMYRMFEKNLNRRLAVQAMNTVNS